MLADPHNLDDIDDPYDGFDEHRVLFKRAMERLGLSAATVWRDSFERMRLSPDTLQAGDDEVVEVTMLMLLKWINGHPRLLE
jgi:hypothetical protein